MIDVILISIAFLILLIGTFTDFKIREVPDWVNYSAVTAGLGLRLLYSASTFEWNYIIAGVFGFGVFFAVALAMFYLGQWGGGDSKMLMGLGALLGLELKPDNILVSFFVNMLIIGALYGLLWSIFLAVKHKKKFLPFLSKIVKTKSYKKAKKILFVFVGTFLIAALVVDFHIKLVLLAFALSIFILFYFFIFLTAVEKTSLIKLVHVEKLTEGDWIVKDVIIGKKRICGPKDLGISKPQIRKLLKLKQKGKIRKILIKEGMPFVPVFLIAYIITFVLGNLVLLFL